MGLFSFLADRVVGSLSLEVFDRPWLVSPQLAPLLHRMLTKSGAMYREMASIARHGLASRTLLGVFVTSRRNLLLLRGVSPRAQPVSNGAVFYSVLQDPSACSGPRGWIETEDDFRAGPLVLAHEIAHFWNSCRVLSLARSPVPVPQHLAALLPPPEQMKWVRARFVDELAARHVAYLCDSYERNETFHRLPPGALFGCAVKIASYPEIYDQSGSLRSLDEPSLRDLVGAWFPALLDLSTMPDSLPEWAEHRRWLSEECRVAELGRQAPQPPLEGTL